MMEENHQKRIFEILGKLPESLKEAFFSVETAEKISEVCEKYEIPAEKIQFIAKCVGHVLLGISSPEEFEGMLEKGAGLKKDTARDVSQQIYRYIFFPVKESLSALSGAGQAPPSEPIRQKEEKPAPPSRPDTYRESVE